MSKGTVIGLVVVGVAVVAGGLYFAHRQTARAAGIPDIPKAPVNPARVPPPRSVSGKKKLGSMFAKFGARAVSKVGGAALNQLSASVPGAAAARTILA